MFGRWFTGIAILATACSGAATSPEMQVPEGTATTTTTQVATTAETATSLLESNLDEATNAFDDGVQHAPCEPADGLELCRVACDSGIQDSCAFLGILLLQEGRPQEAERPLAASCDAQVALGCGGLGSFYGMREDWKAARTYLEKGCSMGDGLACESLGGIAMGFDNAPQPADLDKAVNEAVFYYRRACELGATRACGWVGAAISDGAVEGTLEEALELYVKACNGTDPMGIACRQAVELFYTGTNESGLLALKFDVERLTADLLARGCELGDPQSCELLAD